MNGKLSGRGLVAGVLTGAVAVVMAVGGCSSSGGGTGGGNGGGTKAPAAPATKAAKAKQDPGPLSGKWSGKYSGAFTGTFTLHWRQRGTHLHGMINLSTGGTMPLNGVVHGNVIRFGTVGSTAITYSGTVSGGSMSGTYKVHGSNGSAGGPWSANRA